MTTQTILKVICKHFDLTTSELFKKSRKRKYVEPRQLFHYLCMKYCKATLYQVASYGDMDHSTVLHSIKTVSNLIEVDRGFRNLVNEIDNKINPECEYTFKNNNCEVKIITTSEKKAKEIFNKIAI